MEQKSPSQDHHLSINFMTMTLSLEHFSWQSMGLQVPAHLQRGAGIDYYYSQQR